MARPVSLVPVWSVSRARQPSIVVQPSPPQLPTVPDAVVAAEADVSASLEFALLHEVWQRGEQADGTLRADVDEATRKLLEAVAPALPARRQAIEVTLKALPAVGTVTKTTWDAARAAGGWSPSDGGWTARCAGEGRDYTCGLWTGFHASIANANSDAAAAAALAAVHRFVGVIFGCIGCREHFLAMADGNKFEGGRLVAARTKQDATLWLWRAHNAVNTRLGKARFFGEMDSDSEVLAALERTYALTADAGFFAGTWTGAETGEDLSASSPNGMGRAVGHRAAQSAGTGTVALTLIVGVGLAAAAVLGVRTWLRFDHNGRACDPRLTLRRELPGLWSISKARHSDHAALREFRQ